MQLLPDPMSRWSGSERTGSQGPSEQAGGGLGARPGLKRRQSLRKAAHTGSGLKVVTVLLKVTGPGGDGLRGPSSRSLRGPCGLHSPEGRRGTRRGPLPQASVSSAQAGWSSGLGGPGECVAHGDTHRRDRTRSSLPPGITPGISLPPRRNVQELIGISCSS